MKKITVDLELFDKITLNNKNKEPLPDFHSIMVYAALQILCEEAGKKTFSYSEINEGLPMFTYTQIRRALKKLDSLGLIERKFNVNDNVTGKLTPGMIIVRELRDGE